MDCIVETAITGGNLNLFIGNESRYLLDRFVADNSNVYLVGRRIDRYFPPNTHELCDVKDREWSNESLREMGGRNNRTL